MKDFRDKYRDKSREELFDDVSKDIQISMIDECKIREETYSKLSYIMKELLQDINGQREYKERMEKEIKEKEENTEEEYSSYSRDWDIDCVMSAQYKMVAFKRIYNMIEDIIARKD